ncbi:Scr1 family TA system antitoxin-like transcriptional regulator [Kitasatospora sp. NPDC056783]|uniref:helix-turn-helix domain-containing protein n=1 Tax=Kitasatospora sp. NPDC056783 TaxID=3345943 RepID=UPI0036991137
MNRSEPDPRVSPEAEFGAFLRSSREARGWLQKDVAQMIGCTPTHISMMETGRRRATSRVARGLDTAFAMDRVFINKALAAESATLLEGFAAYVAKESKAIELRLFDLGIVPGLLQTMDYARAIAAGAVRRGAITQDQADERVAVLGRRQAKLRRSPAPQVHAVLDESCITRPVGGPGVMAGQLDALLAFAELPNTLLQIAPVSMGEDRAFDLPVNVITLPDRSLMLYAESAIQGHLERDSGAVAPMITAYYQLQGLALSQAESVAVIRQRRKDLP